MRLLGSSKPTYGMIIRGQAAILSSSSDVNQFSADVASLPKWIGQKVITCCLPLKWSSHKVTAVRCQTSESLSLALRRCPSVSVSVATSVSESNLDSEPIVT